MKVITKMYPEMQKFVGKKELIHDDIVRIYYCSSLDCLMAESKDEKGNLNSIPLQFFGKDVTITDK